MSYYWRPFPATIRTWLLCSFDLRRLVEAWAQDDTSECAADPGMSLLGGPAPYWNSYDHDPVGNRTQETLREPGEPAVTRDYEFPDAGDPQPHTLQQVSASTGQQWEFGYDQAGNTTSRDLDGQGLFATKRGVCCDTPSG